MTAADRAMVALSFVAPIAVGFLSTAGNSSLVWHGSELVWPRFEPVVVLAMIPLLAPLLRLPSHADRSSADADGDAEYAEPTAELVP
jgi:hypothetical protein